MARSIIRRVDVFDFLVMNARAHLTDASALGRLGITLTRDLHQFTAVVCEKAVRHGPFAFRRDGRDMTTTRGAELP